MFSTHCLPTCSSCSLKFWNNFWLEIFIYQADIFIQTHKTTEAKFTCPPGHRASGSTSSIAEFACSKQSDLGFPLPCISLYHIARSVSRKDELESALWLSTRCAPQETYLLSTCVFERGWFKHQHRRTPVKKKRSRWQIWRRCVVSRGVCLSIPAGQLSFLLLAFDNQLMAFLQSQQTL